MVGATIRTLVAGGAAMLLVAGPTLAQQRPPGQIRVAESFGYRFNWDMATDDAYIATRAGALEGLTRLDFDLRLQPSLAVSWHQAGPLVWEFKLREGVRFHDGQAVDAAAVAFSLQRLLGAKVPARLFSPRLVKSVEAAAPDLVRITTAEPMVLLPEILASPSTSIMGASGYHDGRADPVRSGTGPFVMVQADPARGLVLQRNDAYWGGKPKIEGATVVFTVDGSVRATQVRAREVDAARLVPISVLKQLQSTSGVAVQRLSGPRNTEMLLNTAKAPLNDMRVRQAVKAAIDTAGLAASVYEGAAAPATGAFLASDRWAAPEAPAFDLEKARRLLAEAGVKPGTVRLGLLAYLGRPEFKDVATVIQGMLEEVGIGVDIRIAEYSAVEPLMTSGNFDMALFSRGYLADGGDPAGFLRTDYTCTGTFNVSKFCDPAIDATVARASEEPDAAKRAALYQQVASRIQGEAVTIFLINETAFDGTAVRLRNYRLHPLNYYWLTPDLADAGP